MKLTTALTLVTLSGAASADLDLPTTAIPDLSGGQFTTRDSELETLPDTTTPTAATASLKPLLLSSAPVLSATSKKSSTYHLPSDCPPITIEVEPVERQDGQPAPSSTCALGSQFTTGFNNTRLGYLACTFPSSTTGGAGSLTVTLPPTAPIISINGSPGLRRHIVGRLFAVTYQIPHSPLSDTWQPAVAGSTTTETAGFTIRVQKKSAFQ